MKNIDEDGIKYKELIEVGSDWESYFIQYNRPPVMTANVFSNLITLVCLVNKGSSSVIVSKEYKQEDYTSMLPNDIYSKEDLDARWNGIVRDSKLYKELLLEYYLLRINSI